MNGDRTDGGMEGGRGLVCIDPNAPTLRESMWPVVASNVLCLRPLLVGLVVSALYASFLTAAAFSDDGYKDAVLRYAFEYVGSNGVGAARTFWVFFALSLGLWYLLLAGVAVGIVQFYARVRENYTEWRPFGLCWFNASVMCLAFFPISRFGYGDHSNILGLGIYLCYDEYLSTGELLVICSFLTLLMSLNSFVSDYMNYDVRMFLARTLLAAVFSALLLWRWCRDASTFFAFLTAYVCILTYGYGVFTGAFLAMTGGTSWPPFFLMVWERAFHVNIWGFLIWFALFSSGLHYCFENKGKELL